jgi:hypothetical protein
VVPLGDCCSLLPVACTPESTLAPGEATMPESDAPLPGAITPVLLPAGLVADPPVVPTWAKAAPDAARLRHNVLATNKRDIWILLNIFWRAGSAMPCPAELT